MSATAATAKAAAATHEPPNSAMGVAAAHNMTAMVRMA